MPAPTDQVIARVRFALDQLSSRNGHHEFEELARHLVRARIASNVLPATGPIAGRGDQGRDIETFHTYLGGELGDVGWFLALASPGPVAFLCTLQRDRIAAKVKADVEKIVGGGVPVDRIYALLTADLNVAERHALIDTVQAEHGVPLEVLDGNAIAELLASDDLRWICRRFLSVEFDVTEEAVEPATEVPDWYRDLREQWRERQHPQPTLGDTLDISLGLRRATFHLDARQDLPFWLSLMAEVAASDSAYPLAVQKARYELIVGTLRGQGSLRPVEPVVAEYLERALDEAGAIELLDGSVILNYAVGAWTRGVTDFTAGQISGWNTAIAERALELVEDATTDLGRASALQVLAHVRLQPDVTRLQPPDEEVEFPDVIELVDQATGEFTPPALDGLHSTAADLMVDIEGAIAALLDLVEMLPSLPLFPVESLAQQLAILHPLVAGGERWDRILDALDTAVERVAGGSAAAQLSRDRAMGLIRQGRFLEAIRDLHRAKVGWWSGDNLRGSLLVMGVLAQCYADLGLFHAAKQHALGLAMIASSSGDDDLTDLVARGLLLASDMDYRAGAWCGASELMESGLVYQAMFVEDGLDIDRHDEVASTVFNLILMTEGARDLVPEMLPRISAVAERFGFDDVVAEVLAGASDLPPLVERAQDAGFSMPFSDVGPTRVIEFEALGLRWRVSITNDLEHVRAGERLAAATQIVLAEFAQKDLALLDTTIDIDLGLADSEHPAGASQVPSGEGRRWALRLTPIDPASPANPDDVQIELLTVIAAVISEVSLLPGDQLNEAVECAFRDGLTHKLGMGRPYDELAAVIDEATFNNTGRDSAAAVEGYPVPRSLLPWADGPGPTYTREKAGEFLNNRYRYLVEHLQASIPALAGNAEFAETLSELRERGWLDWHILTAVFNVVANDRLGGAAGPTVSDLPRRREDLESAFRPEEPDDEVLPVSRFNVEALDIARRVAMLSLLRNWGLELRQRAPDMESIERFLAKRYGYWAEDVPHDDVLDRRDYGLG